MINNIDPLIYHSNQDKEWARKQYALCIRAACTPFLGDESSTPLSRRIASFFQPALILQEGRINSVAEDITKGLGVIETMERIGIRKQMIKVLDLNFSEILALQNDIDNAVIQFRIACLIAKTPGVLTYQHALDQVQAQQANSTGRGGAQ